MLLQHPLLAAFSPKMAEHLANKSLVQEYREGEILFEENDPSDYIYAVMSGEIALEKEAAPGNFVLISTVGENGFFGELGILYHRGRATRARMTRSSRLAKIDGRDFWMALREEPLEVTIQLMGQVLGYLGDTNRRYLTELLRKEKLQLLGEMAHAMVHDYKNPLTGIQLVVGLIEEEHSDEQTLKWCQMIREHTQHMLGMTRELLDFSWGQKHFHREWVDLPALFDTFIFLNSALLQRANVRFERHCAPIQALVDTNAMLRVLQNLVTNAIEAMEEKGGKVILTGRLDGEHIVIEVSDNGPGIPETIHARLFDPFVTLGKEGGSGLGLAITRSFVQAHGGTILFETDPEQGTRFEIRLPIKETTPPS